MRVAAMRWHFSSETGSCFNYCFLIVCGQLISVIFGGRTNSGLKLRWLRIGLSNCGLLSRCSDFFKPLTLSLNVGSLFRFDAPKVDWLSLGVTWSREIRFKSSYFCILSSSLISCFILSFLVLSYCLRVGAVCLRMAWANFEGPFFEFTCFLSFSLRLEQALKVTGAMVSAVSSSLR